VKIKLDISIKYTARAIKNNQIHHCKLSVEYRLLTAGVPSNSKKLKRKERNCKFNNIIIKKKKRNILLPLKK
jgi:hypothetical protein